MMSDPLIYCWVLLARLCWNFCLWFSSFILASNFLFCSIFVRFWWQDYTSLIEWICGFSFLYTFLAEFEHDQSSFPYTFCGIILWYHLLLDFCWLEDFSVHFKFLCLWFIFQCFVFLPDLVLEEYTFWSLCFQNLEAISSRFSFFSSVA